MKKYIYFLLLSLLFVPTVVHGAEYVNDNQAGATGSISFYGETEEVDKEKDINRIKLPQTGENTSHITMVIGLIIVINSYYYLYIKKRKGRYKMKKIILASAILGVSVMTFGSISTLAATYSSATEAKGTGKIEFEDEGSEIVDPIDPIKPIDPTEPDPNPNTGDLVLQYVPDFNFGKHKKNFNGLTAQALPVKIKEKDSQAAPYDSTLFVSTKDVRTDRGAGWDLVVTSTQFKDATNHVIEGGEVVLTNAAYNGTGDNYKPVPVLAATETELSKGLRLLPGQEVPVATADASKDQGIGSYSLALGELVDGRVTGVTFQMPARTAVNNGEYTASFDWELVAK